MVDTILLQLSYDGYRYDTVLVALAISALTIPYDGDQYDTVRVALEICCCRCRCRLRRLRSTVVLAPALLLLA